MKRILLVPAPNIVGARIEPFMPYGLFSLQATAASVGCDVEIFSLASLRGVRFESSRNLAVQFLRRIALEEYDAIGFSTICNSFHHSLQIATQIRERAPQIQIWMGGPFVSAMAVDILEAFAPIDAIFVGEAEATFAEVCARRIAGRTDLHGIAGILTRGHPFVLRPPILDLDRLPFIDLSDDLLPTFRTMKAPADRMSLPLEASRGCPGQCTFCSSHLYWGTRVRRKSPQRLVAEMDRLEKQAGINQFDLIGDNFGSPRRDLLDFCRHLSSDRQARTWTCSIKMNEIQLADLGVLWDGGCRGIFAGIESASQDTLRRMRKGVNLEKELEIIRRAVEMGFTMETSFIIGFPWETARDIERTYLLHCDLLKRGVFRSAVWVLCPLPGTELTRNLFERLRFGGSASGISHDEIPLDDHTVQLIQTYPHLFSQFGRIEGDHLSWIDLTATAVSATQLMNLYARKKRPPKTDGKHRRSLPAAEGVLTRTHQSG